MVKRPRLPVHRLLLAQLLQSNFLFDSLVSLEEVARTHKILEVFGCDAVGKCESFDLRLANNSFSNNFENSFGGLGVVVNWNYSALMRLVLPRITKFLIKMLPLVNIKQGVLVVRLLWQWLDVRLPCCELC